MAAYMMVELTAPDMSKLQEYGEKIPATLEPFGGRYLVRGGETEVIEGSVGQHPIKVVLEFPSVERAHMWYQSKAYQGIVPLRKQHSTANILLVQGV